MKISNYYLFIVFLALSNGFRSRASKYYVIYTDDQGYADIGAYNQVDI